MAMLYLAQQTKLFAGLDALITRIIHYDLNDNKLGKRELL